MRIRHVIVIVIALSLLGTGSAAGPASFDDPADATLGPGDLDMRTIRHDDTATSIVYTLTMKDPFRMQDVRFISWSLHPDDKSNPCDVNTAGYVDVRDSNGDGVIDAHVNKNLGCAIGYTTVDEGDVIVSHTDGTRDITVRWPRKYLASIGLNQAFYHYTVDTLSSGNPPGVFDDRAPNSGTYRHDLSTDFPSPTPTAPPTPTPSPSPTPAPTPTPSPTLAPTPTPSPTPAPTPTPPVTPTPSPAPTPPPPTPTPPRTPSPAPTPPPPTPTRPPGPTPTPPFPPCGSDTTPSINVGGLYYVWTDGVWQESNGYAGLQRERCVSSSGFQVPPDAHVVPV